MRDVIRCNFMTNPAMTFIPVTFAEGCRPFSTH